ncbi:MAG: sulfotransferase, partial [Actinomycetota bacterium]|nr:sulfotransferase [Actinomycetota bacterium]
ESLVEQPEEELRKLCEFTGLEFDRAMLDYARNAEAVAAGALVPEAHGNLDKPLQSDLRDWRSQMRGHDVALFETIAGPLLEELGYERTARSLGPGVRTLARARWAVIGARRAAARTKRVLKRR